MGRFLAENFPPKSPVEDWVKAWADINGRPGTQAPNHGMALWSRQDVVGAYLAIYSTRVIDGRSERFCNLAVWCVSPGYRSGSIRMLNALLAQDGYHFTDLSPTPEVQRLNLRLGFRYLDPSSQLTLNLPWPTLPRRTRVSSDPDEIARVLTGEPLRYYQDHLRCRWARHAVIIADTASCYVQWRFERRRNLRWVAAIQYVSEPHLFRAGLLSLSRHLAFRHKALFTLVDQHVVGGSFSPSASLVGPPRRMFKSATLGPGDIDYLYSEITAAP
ncbi:hypothetical protein [Flexivirga alba]|uniref:N-acetyltransferase domain-containing protein n=1 Tax=Flexivirga alba TaxID=702742 RepID=A0ABW2AFK4_9MICO